MKRILLIVALFALVAVGFAPAAAQDAPDGIFPGTWPYSLPPTHHLNLFAAGGPHDSTGIGNFYRQLVVMPFGFYRWDSATYEGLLAESWGFNEDNTKYVVTIKEGTWSDGTPLTANDAVVTYAIGRILNWADWNYLSDVVAVDDRTVEFIFNETGAGYTAERLIMKTRIAPAATYQALADEATALIAAGKTSDDQEWTDLATKIAEFRPDVLLASGPYTYSLEDIGDSYMTLHWQPNSIYSGSVQFGEIRLWQGETESTTPLVLNGDIAWATNVYPPATQQAFVDAGIRLVNVPLGYGAALLMQHDTYPFNIKEVRQAMAYAIDRDENAFFTNGFGATGTEYMAGVLDTMVSTLLDADSIAKLNHYDFDVDRAAELMETAGFTRDADGKWVDAEGKRISVEYKAPAEFADFLGASTNAVEQLNEFGFDITLRAIPWQQTAEDIRQGNFQLSVWSWAGGNPLASRQFFGPIQRFNYVGLSDGQKGMNFPMEFEYNGEMINLDALINDVSSGFDRDAQAQRAGRVALILNDLMPFIPLNIISAAQPFNESILTGAPADGDPLYAAPLDDAWMLKLLLEGVVRPAGS
ncbi:MAG: hypothetical protein IT298_07610 [Chloroflexi bacterium]|nr:MAG: putative ABC transporter substrate binding protein [Chloroflexi bacterium OLB13]MCC6565610.1 hypothetical protein [Chloroflexota bacterium]